MIEISLILATYGREFEVYKFIDSLIDQKLPKNLFELIVVDQNDVIDLSCLMHKYHNILNIIYVKSNIKGLSKNRNLGLVYSTGKYVAFPDDDCTYYPDTLSTVISLFNQLDDVDVLLGSIYDLENSKDVLRSWPNKCVHINKINFYKLVTSITIFSKKININFDENLGVGTKFGSNEDAEYIYRCLRSNLKIFYTKDIKVWHPEQRYESIANEKIYSYGMGFGAFIAKYKSVELVLIFIAAIIFHFVKMIYYLASFNISRIQGAWVAIYSRFVGLFVKKN
jgi:glycosyltransferase involved in cell wall biosynthesis